MPGRTRPAPPPQWVGEPPRDARGRAPHGGGKSGLAPAGRERWAPAPPRHPFYAPLPSPKEGLVRIILGNEGLFPRLTKGVVHPGSVRMHFGSWSPPLLWRCPVAELRRAGTVRLASGAGSQRAEQTPPAPARSLSFQCFFFFFLSLFPFLLFFPSSSDRSKPLPASAAS